MKPPYRDDEELIAVAAAVKPWRKAVADKDAEIARLTEELSLVEAGRIEPRERRIEDLRCVIGQRDAEIARLKQATEELVQTAYLEGYVDAKAGTDKCGLDAWHNSNAYARMEKGGE